MNLQYLNDALDFLESLKEPARLEAEKLFPHHPKAQDVWVRLCSCSGGIMLVVETLGLQDDFQAYQQEVLISMEKGLSETAAMQLAGFVDFCKGEVIRDFYMFK